MLNEGGEVINLGEFMFLDDHPEGEQERSTHTTFTNLCRANLPGIGAPDGDVFRTLLMM